MEPTIVLLPYDSPEILKCKMNYTIFINQYEKHIIKNAMDLTKHMIDYGLKKLKKHIRKIHPNEYILYNKIMMLLQKNIIHSECFAVYVIDFMKKQNPHILNHKIATNMWN
tara:strand:+ start:12 stop:344 length:333 start_codon:yes stop_codon:yes gene_type:complete